MAPRRTQLCTFCKKHSIRIGIKNHIRNCPYKTCRCKCCEETRICQRFNRANTKNSRKPVGERTLTLPSELIELLGFENKILEVMKEFKVLTGRNDKRFSEAMFNWIEKGFEIVNRMQMSQPFTSDDNDQHSIQNHSNLPSGLSIESVIKSNGCNGYHQNGNCTFVPHNASVDENFYDSINGYEMKSYGYVMDQQMRSRADNYEAPEMKFTPMFPPNPMPQVPEMILNDAEADSPESHCYSQQEYPHIYSVNTLTKNHDKPASLIELKPYNEHFPNGELKYKKISPASSNSSGSPRLPNFCQIFENK